MKVKLIKHWVGDDYEFHVTKTSKNVLGRDYDYVAFRLQREGEDDKNFLRRARTVLLELCAKERDNKIKIDKVIEEITI